MNVLVFGASGPTGRLIVGQCLERGHGVTAFVRDPARLGIPDRRVRVVTGDTTRDAERIDEAVRGQDVVISTLGRRRSFSSDHLMERSLRLIAPAMERAGVRALIVMSSFGVGESMRDATPIQRILFRLLLRDIFRDKAAAQEFVNRTSLEWTFVYPTLLTDGPATGHYRAGERLELHGLPKVSRADVAHFIVNEMERRDYVRRAVVLSY